LTPTGRPGRLSDAYTGLDMAAFTVAADFPIDGAAAGENLASRFRETSPGVWELRLDKPLAALDDGTLTVSVKDTQGNIARVARRLWIGER
jgi:hypothetical protein